MKNSINYELHKVNFFSRTKEAESSFFRNNLTHLQRKGQLTLMS